MNAHGQPVAPAATAAATLILLLIMAHPATGKTIVRLEARNRAVYDSLDHPRADPAALFNVKPGAVWETRVGTYRFRSGTLAFFRAVGGLPAGCLFRGEGTFSFSPPFPIERGQLRRYCGDSSLTAPLSEVYLRFFDSASAAGLYLCRAEPSSGPLPRDSELRAYESAVSEDLSMRLAARGWQIRRDPAWSVPFLYAAPKLPGQRRLHFIWDDAAEEAVTLWRRPPGAPSPGAGDLVCSYDRPRTAAELALRLGTLHGGLLPSRCVARVTIAPSTVVTVDARLTLILRRAGIASFTFAMAPGLDMDTVWIDGAVAPFVYDDVGGWIVVGTPTGPELRDSVEVRTVYRGPRLLYKFPWGDFFISYTTRWLPTTTFVHRTTYETTFCFPRHYDLVSVGELVSDSIEGDWRLSRWRTYEPVSFISFNYGSFDRLSVPVSLGPRLDIYRSRNHPRGLFNSDMKKQVATEISGAVSLFSRVFGPYPWDHLAATEIPAQHGQGFPQLLHLAWYSFETSRKGITDAFIAHEVAHQWFGHLVGWQTYHDQWLSEGFAEYASAMYVEARHPGNDEFLSVVRRWRNQILQSGGHGAWHAGPQVAPIWLGVRCASASSPGSYSHLVYAKGAYVLHMLRQMLRDYRTGSDDRFLALMRDYVGRLAHADAATADFQRVVEEHLGMPMQWFFDQWVYGVQIPRLEYRWHRQRTSDGRYIIAGQIDQFDCDSTFRCFLPITFIFDSGQTTILQEVVGPHTRFASPALPQNPREVRFNDGRAVLARERVVDKP